MTSETGPILERIDALIAFYQRTADRRYLLLEEYRENAPAAGRLRYTVEIKEYDEQEAQKNFGDEKLMPVSDNMYMKQRTNLASETDTSRIYAEMTGQEVVARLTKLYHMVQLKMIQPPGVMANGLPHRPFPISRVTLLITSEGMACCGHPEERLTNARYLGSKVAEPDVKALQCILHNMQYDDEMDWKRYRDDGLFGPRTRSAVQAFAQEVNFVDRDIIEKPLLESGEFVTADIAAQLRYRCASGWKRPSYLQLTDPEWDYSKEAIERDERNKWRSMYHVRQLQLDLKVLGFDPTLDSSGVSDPQLIDGLFGSKTARALKRFQQAALQGLRFDFATSQLVRTETVTFTGKANGVLDGETKREIARWLDYLQPTNVMGETPAKPVAGAGPEMPQIAFAELVDGQLLSHPEGYTDIKIMRKGDGLQYFLPGDPAARLVPRPLLPEKSPPEQKKIQSVQWGVNDVYQTAFKVTFGPSSSSPPGDGSDLLDLSIKEYYLVNKFGMARQASADLISLFYREPLSLEVMPLGLEVERKRGMLTAARPAPARFDKVVRYHMLGTEYSMYVFSSDAVEIIKDTTGETLASYSQVVDLQISHMGDVRLTWNDPAGVVTISFDLRGPTLSRTAHGALGEEPGRKELMDSVRTSGFVIVEKGNRFTLTELQAADSFIKKWRGATGLSESIKSKIGKSPSLVKDVLVEGGSYNPGTGEIKIPGYVEMSETEQKNVVIHELAHAFFHAAGLFISLGKVTKNDSKKKQEMDMLIEDVWLDAELENATTLEEMKLSPELTDKVKAVAEAIPVDAALLVRLMSRAGFMQISSQDNALKEGPVVDSPIQQKRKLHEWVNVLCRNEELNEAWESLHSSFDIPDLENSLDKRGLEIADESRYMGPASPRGDVVGHGFDNVSEFVSSFVASTLRYQKEMSEAIAGSKSASLKSRYEEVWNLVNANLVNLGEKNPYE